VVGGGIVGGDVVGGGEVGAGLAGAGLAGAPVVVGSAEPPSSPDEQAIGPRRRPATANVAAPRTNQGPSRDVVSGRRFEGSVVGVGSEVMLMVRV
jgi:hypothetical protein